MPTPLARVAAHICSPLRVGERRGLEVGEPDPEDVPPNHDPIHNICK